jgi:hypothetical protein
MVSSSDHILRAVFTVAGLLVIEEAARGLRVNQFRVPDTMLAASPKGWSARLFCGIMIILGVLLLYIAWVLV